MAESIADIGDDSEKNFILAKLVSLFGHKVDFDVIKLLAQENEWNEENCTDLLKVLSDYKNSEPTPVASKIIESSVSDIPRMTSYRTEDSKAPQRNKPVYSTATKMAGHPTRNTPFRLLEGRPHSPAKMTSQKPKERSLENQEHHDRVKSLIETGQPVLILLRGLPGSGKSTLAKNLLALSGAKAGCCQSTDNFFVVSRSGKRNVEYQYDPLRLGEAHEWNRVQVLRAIAHGVSPIIVDNTNVKKWEMLPYVEMALEPWRAERKLRKMAANGSIPKNNICSSLGPARLTHKGKKCPCGFTVKEISKVPYHVELLEPLTWWYRNPSRLAKVNQHGVSQKKITQMLSHFEFDLTGESLVQDILQKKSHLANNASDLNVRSGASGVRPTLSANKAGHPVYNVNPKMNPGGELGTNPRPPLFPRTPGNNAFQHNSVNQFQNPSLFTSPFFGFPSSMLEKEMKTGIPFSSGQNFSTSQKSITKNSKPKEMAGDGFKNEEGSNAMPPNMESLFSKSATDINLSSMDNKLSTTCFEEPENIKKNKSLSMSSTDISSNDNASNSETSSFLETECVEMTEEELRQWIETNNSRWGWESSDEDSEDEGDIGSTEPKPARSPRQRHRNSSSEMTTNIEETEVDRKGCTDLNDETEDKEEISDWVTEEFDALKTWNIPKSVSTDCSDNKTNAPLPPRNSRRKRLFDKYIRPSDAVDKNQTSIIKQLHTLLGEFGTQSEESDSSSHQNENTSDKLLPLGKPDNEDEISNSKILLIPDTAVKDSVLKSESLTGMEYGIVSSGEIHEVLKFGDNKDSPFEFIQHSELESTIINSNNSSSKTEIKDQLILKDKHSHTIIDNLKKDEQPLPIAFNAVLSKSDEETENTETSLTMKHGETRKLSGSESLQPLVSISDDGSKNSDGSLQKSLGVIDQIKAAKQEESEDHKTPFSTCDEGVEGNARDIFGETLFFTSKDDILKASEIVSEGPFSKSAVGKENLIEDFLIGESVENQMKEIDGSTEASRIDCVSLIEFDDSVVDNKTLQPLAQNNFDNSDLNNKVSTELLSKNSSSVFLSDDVNFSNAVEEKESLELQNMLFADDFALAKNILPKRMSCIESLQHSLKSMVLTNEPEILITDNVAQKEECKEKNITTENSEFVCDNEIVPIGACGSNIEVATHTATCSAHVNEDMSKEKSDEEAVEIPTKNIHEHFQTEFLSPKISPLLGANEDDQTFHKKLSENDVEEDFAETSKIDMVEEKEEKYINVDLDMVNREMNNKTDYVEEGSTFSLVLDHNFIRQICQQFGNPYEESMEDSSKFSIGQGNNASGVTVQVPTLLAKKLHECWLKTQWKAILEEEETSQKMILEDELLARQLQEFEKEDLKEKRDIKDPSTPSTPNLREIMDMEMAMAIYKAEQDKESQLGNKNDISTRLSWDLLTKEFPHIPQDVVSQIFAAYKFSYNSTKEALQSSLPDYEKGIHENAVKDVISPEALAEQEKTLIEKAKLESLKQCQKAEVYEEGEPEKESEVGWETLVDQARKSAALNRRLQRERHAQSQAASRSGIRSAAAYYCRMAALHKQKVEEADRKAANILSRVFTGDFKNLKDSTSLDGNISQPPTTLDMHSMSVLESLRVVNAFLDAHADWMKNHKSTPNSEKIRRATPVKMVSLFLITGRGMNSLGGIPRIKPAVERLLEQRGVWYEELNPGLLRVMISANLPPAKKV